MNIPIYVLFCALIGSADQRSVAFIDEATGDIRVVRIDSKTQKPTDFKSVGRAFGSVREGDEIRVGRGARVADEHWAELGTGRFNVVHGECVPIGKAVMKRGGAPTYLQSPRAQAVWNSLKQGTGIAAGPVVRSGTADTSLQRRFPRIIPIANEFIASDRPDFSWSVKPGAKEYVVELRTSVTQRTLWKATSAINQLKYPIGVAPLAQGRIYSWNVFVRGNDGTESPFVDGRFGVDQPQDPKETAMIHELATSQSAMRVLIAASMYQERDMLSAAVASYERLAELVPNEPMVWRQLAQDYEQAGRTEEAQKAIENAKRLESSESAR